jgi:hypothetical protein
VDELSRRNAEAGDTKSATTKGKSEPDAPEPENAEPANNAPAKAAPVRAEPVNAEPAKAGREAAEPLPFFIGDPPTPLPSEPTSDSRKKPGRTTSNRASVKEELREIAAAKKQKEAGAPKPDERLSADKSKNTPATTAHKQPQRGKSKSKKSKGNR